MFFRYVDEEGLSSFYFGTVREVTLSRIVRNQHYECVKAPLANKGGPTQRGLSIFKWSDNLIGLLKSSNAHVLCKTRRIGYYNFPSTQLLELSCNNRYKRHTSLKNLRTSQHRCCDHLRHRKEPPLGGKGRCLRARRQNSRIQVRNVSVPILQQDVKLLGIVKRKTNQGYH